MRYNVAQLIKGPTGASRSYEFCEDIGNLDPGLEPICPLEGRITFLRTSQGILVTVIFEPPPQQYGIKSCDAL